ncbi:MAG TPA: GGDEF domain-containing protein [Sulfurimonas sp.]|uniref:bifunctional diguanylate cyclase/phosphodiesterase n=1 Tax=Sulfurimonas sp. TaxID=2022749 RepID=UPI002B762A45|nr:GGDEF domain-containing protein [Sulfurimonas sp.]HUH42949.1 GGDEF domain-containing protein [Sulfurimonas sp.]
MLLPQTKEREYRFRLALRMVFPIFTLISALFFHTFFATQESLSVSFYVEILLILLFSIYFIFYLIYKGFDAKITDNISNTFTREYIYKYLKKEIKKSDEYTLILISIDNLYEINSKYGMKNGDKVLSKIVIWIEEYLKTKDIENFPIGRIKGGDFIIGLYGNKDQYKSIAELMCLKSEEFKVDEIEIQISLAINDIKFSKNIDFLIENLFELQSKNRDSKFPTNIEDEINPSDLEYFVINAIKNRDLDIFMQDVFEDDKQAFKECSIKLNTPDKRLIHQKNYMKVLDKLRLMNEYDIIVLEKIVEICKKTDDEKFAISLAATSIRNPVTFGKIKEIIYKNECVKGRIIILFSENEYFSKIDKFNGYLDELRDFGILIAIDRLGALHTSFLYLRDLNIDIVRFDSYYSKKISENKSENIVSGFNTMAQKKGVKTWMKMIEDEDTKKIAKEMGVNYLQGKYLAPLK